MNLFNVVGKEMKIINFFFQIVEINEKNIEFI